MFDVPVSAVPIPDEALARAAEAASDAHRLGDGLGVHKWVDVVHSVAPFIARAAQVQVLREMAEELTWNAATARDRLGGQGMKKAADHLRERADQIDRGER